MSKPISYVKTMLECDKKEQNHSIAADFHSKSSELRQGAVSIYTDGSKEPAFTLRTLEFLSDTSSLIRHQFFQQNSGPYIKSHSGLQKQ